MISIPIPIHITTLSFSHQPEKFVYFLDIFMMIRNHDSDAGAHEIIVVPQCIPISLNIPTRYLDIPISLNIPTIILSLLGISLEVTLEYVYQKSSCKGPSCNCHQVMARLQMVKQKK